MTFKPSRGRKCRYPTASAVPPQSLRPTPSTPRLRHRPQAGPIKPRFSSRACRTKASPAVFSAKTVVVQADGVYAGGVLQTAAQLAAALPALWAIS